MKKIGIIMGSDSDLPVVEKAMTTLDEFGVPYEVHVFSAHRTPVEAKEFSANARANGFGAIIAAAGKAGVVSAQHVSESQIVLDVGINITEEGNLVGDVDFAAVEPVVSAITPVPAGVGSVTTAVLAKHVVTAAEKTL